MCPAYLLITFANSLDPDQAWRKPGPDLDPNYLASILMVSLKTFWKEFVLGKTTDSERKKACTIIQHAQSTTLYLPATKLPSATLVSLLF